VPSDKAASDIPFGITLFSLSENEGLICDAADLFMNHCADSLPMSKKDTTLVAVCGLYMRGFSFEKQMHECGARFVREAVTAAKYQLVKLPTVPAKPGLIKKQIAGASIHLEIWEMPLDSFGSFVTSIPGPLGIGKIEPEDGSEISGFICEAYAAMDGEDITSFGG
jgi:allophanate hydrolase